TQSCAAAHRAVERLDVAVAPGLAGADLRARRLGAMLGAIQADNFPGKTNRYGQAAGNHASSRTGPDSSERPDRYLRADGRWFESQDRAASARVPGPARYRTAMGA